MFQHVSLFKMRLIFIVTMLSLSLVSQSQRPNIIYIMSDDMGYGDLSGYGRKDYQTPNLDKLASQGIKFVNAYAAAPLCTPTRAAFMTGRYPARTPVGLREPLTPSKEDSTYGLTTEFPSVATLMKAGGYETALIGKWHLGFLPQHSPVKNGFDYFFGIHSGAADYISHKGDGGADDLYENDSIVHPEGYLTDLFAQKAISIIKRPRKKPFFLVVTFNAPHWPWQGPLDKAYADTADFRNGGSKTIYAAMMKSLDDAVGNIMKALNDEHLSENTIVFFTNDNGGERYSDNGGLSNGKATLWEGGIRVPAFIRWPGKIKPGITTQQLAITMDWTATILSAASLRADPRFPPDGINLMPICLGKKGIAKRTFYWKRYMGNKQIALRDGKWKYLHDKEGDHLFNLHEDQGEKYDLKEKFGDVLEELKKKYNKWEETVLRPAH